MKKLYCWLKKLYYINNKNKIYDINMKNELNFYITRKLLYIKEKKDIIHFFLFRNNEKLVKRNYKNIN